MKFGELLKVSHTTDQGSILNIASLSSKVQTSLNTSSKPYLVGMNWKRREIRSSFFSPGCKNMSVRAHVCVCVYVHTYACTHVYVSKRICEILKLIGEKVKVINFELRFHKLLTVWSGPINSPHLSFPSNKSLIVYLPRCGEEWEVA